VAEILRASEDITAEDVLSGSRLPVLSPRELKRILEKVGFQEVRTTGGHVVMRNETVPSRTVAIPGHGKQIPPGTLFRILKDSGITPEDARRLG